MKCPRCQHENRPTATFCEDCGTPFELTKQGGPPVASYGELQRALTEALDQRTASSQILRVISGSQTDVQAVLDAIARSAAALTSADFGGVLRTDGRRFYLAAIHGLERERLDPIKRLLASASVDYETLGGRVILSRSILHVADMEAMPSPPAASLEFAHAIGFRSQVIVPMLRGDETIGAVAVGRREPGPFSDSQIELLQTFADQAVIAIENVRLFTELQEKNKALTQANDQVTEALDQQTATAEILRVIASSPASVEAVFDTILANALRLCDTPTGGIFTFDGQAFHISASARWADDFLASFRDAAILPGPETPLRRVGLELRPSHVADIFSDPSFSPPEMYRREGMRTALAVPMLKEGRLVGALTFHRREVRPFTKKQIALIETFADHAVIAIENVRLFTELQEKNRALTQAHAEVTEALEQQTATGEILSVISSSPTDIQPVLDALVRSAVRFCGAHDAAIHRLDGPRLQVAAHHGPVPYRPIGSVIALVRGTVNGRSVLERRPIHVIDLQAETEEFPEGSAAARTLGFRTALSVPLLREGVALGTINLRRSEAVPFTDKQITLLKTFADQAVIAIENVRLLTELQARTAELTRSVDELTALGDVSRAITSTLDLDTVLETIVARAVQLSGADAGSIYEYDERTQELTRRAVHNMEAEILARPDQRFRRGEGALGQAVERRRPVQFADISEPAAYESKVRDLLLRFGYRALLAVPLLREDQIIGALVVNRKTPGDFLPETVELLTTFATQSALAIQNARLFREIEQKSRELEAVSRHKSEFLANMSHELRTPLNAIIGFSEVLGERMFGELNEKQEEYLKDIHASGQHLLSLINDILDLSKIEAGRMELELTDFDLPTAIDNALTLVRERAGRRGIALHQVADEGLGQIRGDERKLRQVLLNLLSNAIKFTPEGGRIDVRAVLGDGVVEVSVTDTGVGIAPEDQEAIFEEFRQVGTADKKVEGTGLGLALSRKFIELHGGRIWVQSQMGVGSTFTFTIPMQQER
jgi:signal transduction histidine kinase